MQGAGFGLVAMPIAIRMVARILCAYPAYPAYPARKVATLCVCCQVMAYWVLTNANVVVPQLLFVGFDYSTLSKTW